MDVCGTVVRMQRKFKLLLGAAAVLVAVGARAALGFPATSHPVEAATLGKPIAGHELDDWVDRPGPVTVETVVGCDWAVPRSGVINLEHPTAKSAGLQDGDEPIVILFHVIRHPTRGLFFVDTGVERALRDDPDHAIVHGLMASVMHREKMRFHVTTAEWLRGQQKPSGVFLTHLHFDHVTGMRDVPASTPVYAGPGEAKHRSFMNFFTESSADQALSGKGPLREWKFAPDPDGQFAGILDIFGDRSVFALQVPGHTQGSTAYVARTPQGAVLFTGDASHTTWGFAHEVEPGTYSEDAARGRDSFQRLKRFSAKHPRMDVRVGHQLFPQQAVTRERPPSPP
jgi:glyoxylase-like metal-dependent hydrolase (beta-lactamase superfamily II)